MTAYHPDSLIARYLDTAATVGIDAHSQGKYLAGQALHAASRELRGQPAKSDTQLLTEWRFGAPEKELQVEEVVRRAQELIAAKIQVPSMDLRYREALRAAQRILEEVE